MSEKCANPDGDYSADAHHHSNPDGRIHTDQDNAEKVSGDVRKVEIGCEVPGKFSCAAAGFPVAISQPQQPDNS